MYIRQEAIDKAELFRLFEHAQSADDNLAREEMISRWQGSGSCSITGVGYRVVEDALASLGSFHRLYREHGDEWLSTQTIELEGISAADRIVSRADNSDLFDGVSQHLDTIRDELESNNEIGATLGDDKDLIIGEIDASKVLTSGRAFNLSRLIALIAPALKFLIEKFASSTVGEAAKRLTQLLFELH